MTMGRSRISQKQPEISGGRIQAQSLCLNPRLVCDKAALVLQWTVVNGTCSLLTSLAWTTVGTNMDLTIPKWLRSSHR